MESSAYRWVGRSIARKGSDHYYQCLESVGDSCRFPLGCHVALPADEEAAAQSLVPGLPWPDVGQLTALWEQVGDVAAGKKGQRRKKSDNESQQRSRMMCEMRALWKPSSLGVHRPYYGERALLLSGVTLEFELVRLWSESDRVEVEPLEQYRLRNSFDNAWYIADVCIGAQRELADVPDVMAPHEMDASRTERQAIVAAHAVSEDEEEALRALLLDDGLDEAHAADEHATNGANNESSSGDSHYSFQVKSGRGARRFARKKKKQKQQKLDDMYDDGKSKGEAEEQENIEHTPVRKSTRLSKRSRREEDETPAPSSRSPQSAVLKYVRNALGESDATQAPRDEAFVVIEEEGQQSPPRRKRRSRRSKRLQFEEEEEQESSDNDEEDDIFQASSPIKKQKNMSSGGSSSRKRLQRREPEKEQRVVVMLHGEEDDDRAAGKAEVEGEEEAPIELDLEEEEEEEAPTTPRSRLRKRGRRSSRSNKGKDSQHLAKLKALEKMSQGAVPFDFSDDDEQDVHIVRLPSKVGGNNKKNNDKGKKRGKKKQRLRGSARARAHSKLYQPLPIEGLPTPDLLTASNENSLGSLTFKPTPSLDDEEEEEGVPDDLADFVVDDGGEVNVALPDGFSAHRRPQEAFRIYLEYLVSHQMDEEWRAKMLSQAEQRAYFMTSVRQTEKMIASEATNVAGSVWKDGMKYDLKTLPARVPFQRRGQVVALRCDACRIQLQKSYRTKLSGWRYDADKFWNETKLVYVGETLDSQHSSESAEAVEIVYDLGPQCAQRTYYFHQLSHYKLRLWNTLAARIEQVIENDATLRNDSTRLITSVLTKRYTAKLWRNLAQLLHDARKFVLDRGSNRNGPFKWH